MSTFEPAAAWSGAGGKPSAQPKIPFAALKREAGGTPPHKALVSTEMGRRFLAFPTKVPHSCLHHSLTVLSEEGGGG